jgi:hypothetical protein
MHVCTLTHNLRNKTVEKLDSISQVFKEFDLHNNVRAYL